MSAVQKGPVIPNGPDTKHGLTFVYVNIPLLAVCAGVVGFRVWWRCIKNSRGALNRADICVVIGLIFNIIQTACVCTAILKYGFGHHAPYLSVHERYMSLLYFFVFQCFVKDTVGISKLSLLFLYLDIFPQRKFRIMCWGVIIHISLGLIALSLATIFQCSPIEYSWNKTIHGGKCINIKAFWYGQSAWNTLMDVVVLVMPIPVIVKLNMNRRSKLGLLVVFILGAFVCVTSIERLISLNFNATFAKDFTWATGTSVIWTQVESTVGVICACAPSLRAPLARFVPILFGASGKEDSYELSDAVPHHLGPRSGNWTDQSKSSKGSRKRGELDTVDILETRTTLRGDGSQEQIVGIKKTVSFDMTYTERSEEMMTEEGKETYPKYQYDRHVV